MNESVIENQPAHERTHAAEQALVNEPSLQTAVNTAAVQAILQALRQTHQFEESQIKTDSESLEHWGKDWTKHFAPAAS
ncbi:FAD-binding oxidoreductase, partial [Psychrobacter sp. 1Y11]